MVYSSFEINNFRLFEHVLVDNLKKINLIVGKNNVGKTSLLEALFIHSGYYNPELTIRINAWRGMPGFVTREIGKNTPWDDLFYNLNIDSIITLSSKQKGYNSRKTKLNIIPDLSKIPGLAIRPGKIEKEISTVSYSSFSRAIQVQMIEGNNKNTYYLILDEKGITRYPSVPVASFQTVFQPSMVRFSPKMDTDRFSKLKINGKEDLLIESLKEMDNRIKDMTISTIGSEPQLYVDVGLKEYVPLLVSGQGMVKLTTLILSISEAENGIMLIDEIENGFHHSLLPKIWKIIDKASKIFNTQIFATTHSRETIIAAHKTFSENDDYDFGLQRLEKINDEIKSIFYDKNTLEAAIDMDLEVR